MRINLVLALRRLRSEWLYSVIKITGLAVALSCTFLIYLYISDELRFDRHNDNPEQLYRIIEKPYSDDETDPRALTPFPLKSYLYDHYSHLVKDAARLFNQQVPRVSLNYIEGDRRFNETRFFFADSSIFRIFDVQFVQGDPETALSVPDGLVMTTKMAQRYFGDADPIGRVIRFDGRFNLVVSGIIEPLPETSHVQFDALGAMASLRGLYRGGIPDVWDWSPLWTYVRLQDDVTLADFNQALLQLSDEVLDRRRGSPMYLEAQPVVDIRLNSNLYGEIGPTSNRQYVFILGYIGLFILCIAGINFINLSLAGSGARTLEVGMRKVLGAEKKQIFNQYLGESLFTGFISLIAAVLLIIIVLPWYASVAGKTTGLSMLMEPGFWVFAFLVTLIVTGIAGAYPALVLANWSPLKLFRGDRAGGSGGTSRLSKVLIVVQFAVASFLIAGTWIVLKQLDHIQSQRLGFDQEQTIVLPVALSRMIFFFDSFKEQTEQHPDIRQVVGISEIIGYEHQTFNYSIPGYQNGDEVTFPFYFVTEGFEQMLGLSLVAGRAFRADMSTDATESVIVNEQFVRRMGWGSAENAIGKEVRRDQMRFRVIGVVQDFNFASLRNEVEPLLFELPKVIPSQIAYVMIKINPGSPTAALNWTEEKWKEVDMNRQFEYFFLDERIRQLYDDEQQLASVAGFFSLIAILISCFGLFGLASYTTSRKSRSIGIRKVLGATPVHLVLLLTKEFVVLVILANLIAIPLIFLFMGRWLDNFAYQITIGPEILIATFILTLIIAFFSVFWQTWRAANQNPVKSIRYE